jgi:hypothetical protein
MTTLRYIQKILNMILYLANLLCILYIYIYIYICAGELEGVLGEAPSSCSSRLSWCMVLTCIIFSSITYPPSAPRFARTYTHKQHNNIIMIFFFCNISVATWMINCPWLYKSNLVPGILARTCNIIARFQHDLYLRICLAQPCTHTCRL